MVGNRGWVDRRGLSSEQKPADIVGRTHTALRVRGVGEWSGQSVEHQGKLTGGHALGCTHDQPGD